MFSQCRIFNWAALHADISLNFLPEDSGYHIIITQFLALIDTTHANHLFLPEIPLLRNPVPSSALFPICNISNTIT